MTFSLDEDEFRQRFLAMLDRVDAGDRITVTRRGVPIARLVPVDDNLQSRDWPAFWRRVDQRRSHMQPPEHTISDDIRAGRR